MIKRRRETLGFSQARLGELVGRSASTIRNWERGKSTPSAAADARALAAVLGLNEGRVVEAAGFEPTQTESHQTVEQAYATLAPQPPEIDEEAEEEPEDSKTEQAITGASSPPEEEAPAEDTALTDPGPSQPDEQVEADAEEAPPEEDAPEDGATPEPEEEKESSPSGEEHRFETPAPPSRPERARAPEGRRLRPVAAEGDDEPAVARAAPPTILEAAPPAEPSYLEDPDERQRYRIRALVTAAVVIFLLIVFFWSVDQTVEALGSMWDEFTGMLEI